MKGARQRRGRNFSLRAAFLVSDRGLKAPACILTGIRYVNDCYCWCDSGIPVFAGFPKVRALNYSLKAGDKSIFERYLGKYGASFGEALFRVP